MDDAALQSQFTDELLALEHSGAGMPFTFKPSEAFRLLSLLQLALRHPSVNADDRGTGQFAKALAENIQGRLCKTPAMQELARRGWDTAYDTAAEEKPAAAPPPAKPPTKPRGRGK